MEPAIDIYEQIDRYLRNELSGQELADFNSKLSSDAEFKRLVEVQRIVNKTIINKEMIDLKKRMIKDFNDAGKSSFNWLKLIGISSVVIVSIGIGYYLLSNKSESPKSTIQDNKVSTLEIRKAEYETEVKPSVGVESNKSSNKNSSVTLKDSPMENLDNQNSQLAIEQTVDKSNSSNISTKGTGEGDPTHVATQTVIEKAKVDCGSVKIIGEAKVYFAKGDELATIIIDKLSIKGGTAPYTFSMDENVFSSKNTFHDVEEGRYQIRIKDQNNCISVLPNEIVVKVPEKEIDDAFAPGQNERWKFPLKGSSDASIKIINKAGTVVYSATIVGGFPEEWDGRSNTGVDLEAGNYYFQIQNSRNETINGHISIMR